MDKTYVFDNNDGGCGGNGMMGLIASLCNQRGLDPNLVAALMNNNRGYGDGFGNSAWWIIILLIFGWGGFGGFGGGFNGRGNAQGLADLGNLVNNDAGRDLIMQAIQGNATAISQLASTVHCDTNQLASAIQSVSSQICNLGNTLGLGQRDIIQQMLMGNQGIISQVCNCCCDLRQQIADFKGDLALQMCKQTGTLSNGQRDLGVAITKGFCDSAYATREQTCELKNTINEGFAKIKEREDQREIQNLRDQVQALQLSASQQAQTRNIIDTVRPCPSPAYITCNPWGCNGQFVGNGYPYGGYPYGGGCCGNNNGCCNSGCGC